MKRINIIVFIFSCFMSIHIASSAQQSKVDSLLTLLKKDKEDTNKVNHINLLSRQYINIGAYDSAERNSNLALKLAEQLNPSYKKGIANTYSNIGHIYYLKSDYAKTLEYWLKALKIDEELNNKEGIAKRLGNIGNIYRNQGDYPKALDYFLKALKIDEEIGAKNLIATALLNIGTVYQFQSDYPKSLDYFFRGLKILEELGDKNYIAAAFGNIGNVYLNQLDYPKALDYYYRGLKLAEELGNRNTINLCLGNIGIVYKKQADYPKALDCYFRVLKLAKELEDKNEIAVVLGNIGSIYREQGNYPEALDYYFKSLKLAEELGDKKVVAMNLHHIGKLYTKTGKFSEAEVYLKRAIAIDDSIGSHNDLMEVQGALSDLYDTTSQYKLALAYYKKAMVLKDTLYSQENKKQLVRKEMNYEFDKKEALAKAEQEKKDAVVEEEKRRQKLFLISVIGGLLLVIVFAGFVFRSLRVTRKQKQIIEVKSKETEQQKHIIEEKNKDITDSINYARRIQRAMLPHRKDIWAAFPQSFVLYKPKDIVSGDFYFFHPNNNSYFIAAADCTGHGVPGAFMSMIGAARLNDAVAARSDTSEVLSLLNIGVKTALKQSEDDQLATRDGMDIALCSVDMENRIVKYAGANRPIWIVRKDSTAVEEIKATKKAIGGFTENSQHYDTHEIKLNEGDTFYLSTDGYADTFGKDGKKMMTKRFKEILLSIQDKTMKEQEKYLNDFVEDWKSGTEQVDDILVIGIRM